MLSSTFMQGIVQKLTELWKIDLIHRDDHSKLFVEKLNEYISDDTHLVNFSGFDFEYYSKNLNTFMRDTVMKFLSELVYKTYGPVTRIFKSQKTRLRNLMNPHCSSPPLEMDRILKLLDSYLDEKIQSISAMHQIFTGPPKKDKSKSTQSYKGGRTKLIKCAFGGIMLLIFPFIPTNPIGALFSVAVGGGGYWYIGHRSEKIQEDYEFDQSIYLIAAISKTIDGVDDELKKNLKGRLREIFTKYATMSPPVLNISNAIATEIKKEEDNFKVLFPSIDKFIDKENDDQFIFNFEKFKEYHQAEFKGQKEVEEKFKNVFIKDPADSPTPPKVQKKPTIQPKRARNKSKRP